MPQASFTSVLLYCRSGFEKECAAEIVERAESCGVAGFVKAKPESGYVVFQPHVAQDAALLSESLDFDQLVFARQLIFCLARLDDLPLPDRTPPIVDAVRGGGPYADVLLETADTNEAKELSGFCRKFEPHLRRALDAAKLLRPGHKKAPRLHLFFLDSSACYAGVSLPGNCSPWPMGIPRLRLARAAPSRSALKLAEALHTLLSDDERAARLKPGMKAVDLGAAPGGWSWHLAGRGVRVTAVDNGPMSRELLAGEMVEHVRSDGFTYRPPRPVDWLVCDMAEQPSRIAALVAQWLGKGWCRDAMFNLKLPMNKRYDEVRHCRALIDQRLRSHGVPARLRIKQLYHDREEVTGYLHRLPPQ